MAKIVIETNGWAEGTTVTVNGELWDLSEFSFSVRVPFKKNGKLSGGGCKMQAARDIAGKTHFLSYYGPEFEKFDEVTQRNRELEEKDAGQGKVGQEV